MCRVCRGEGTLEQPLFYPCLCSGSIRYIHQDCLVEWLKHSKKKYPSYVAIAFTEFLDIVNFASIHLHSLQVRIKCTSSVLNIIVYREHMPKRLPISLVLKGLLKKGFFGLTMLIRYLFVTFAWVVVLPYFTVQSLRYYFGWTLLEGSVKGHLPEGVEVPWIVRAILDAGLGLAMFAAGALSVIGLMMLKEYMEQHNLFDFITHPPPVEQPDSPASGNEEDTGVVEPGSWLEQVTPREYRAFLRRREYHRERSERLRVRHHEVQSQKNAEILRMIDAGLSEVESVGRDWETNSEATERTEAETFNPYNLDDTTAMGSVTSLGDFTEASGLGRRGQATGASGVVFRESFRCRICQKRSCINREHVLQASQQQQLQDQPPPIIERDHRDRNRNDAWPLFNFAVDFIEEQPGVENNNNRVNEQVTVMELAGYDGSLMKSAGCWIALLVAAQGILHWCLILPMILGMFVVDGTLPTGFQWIKGLTSSIASNTAIEDEYGLKPMAIQLANNLVSFWDRSLSLITSLTSWNLASYRPAHVKAFLLSIKPILFHPPGPVGLTLLRLLAGYGIVIALSAAIFFSIYHFARPYNALSRQSLSILYLYGAFFKLVLVTSVMVVICPLYAGWLLAICTLSLFKATFIQRLQFQHSSPLLSSLLHFLPGLLFSFSLSYSIIGLRKIVRPGLLYFIRNPDDPEDHYVKDVLGKPIVGQIISMAPTFIFYAGIICTLVGSTSSLLTQLFPSIVPLRMTSKEPIYSLPTDIILQGISKLILDIINPYFFKTVLLTLFKTCLKKLCMSSYFLGGRYIPEESFPLGGRWVFVPDFDRAYKRERLRALKNREVQPTDVAKLPIMEGRLNGELTPNPVDFSSIPQPRRTIIKKPARREDNKGFTVVYRPNNFKLRFIALVLCLFAYWLLSCVLLFVAPLMTGRYIFTVFSEATPRDTHTFVLGLLVFGTLLRGVIDLSKAVYASDPKLVYRALVVGPTIAVKATLVSFFVIGLWPVMIGTFVLLCLSFLWKDTDSFVLHYLTEIWSAGLGILKAVYHVRHQILPRQYCQAIEKLSQDGYTNIDVTSVFRNLIIPVTTRLLARLTIPLIIATSLNALLGVPRNWGICYTFYGSFAFFQYLVKALFDLRTQLITQIRNENYLIGNQLRNVEASPTRTVPAPAYGSPASTYGGARSVRSVLTQQTQPSMSTM